MRFNKFKEIILELRRCTPNFSKISKIENRGKINSQNQQTPHQLSKNNLELYALFNSLPNRIQIAKSFNTIVASWRKNWSKSRDFQKGYLMSSK